jgi:hypothetical protein
MFPGSYPPSATGLAVAVAVAGLTMLGPMTSPSEVRFE